MKRSLRLIIILLSTTGFFTTLPVVAQLNDGKPDPDYAVPDRLDLEYSLAFALDNNFAIRQAKERIRQQEGVVLEVKSSAIPNVGATGGYQRNDAAIGVIGEDKTWAFSITAHQLLYAGGGVRAGIRGQELSLDAATLELQSIINDALLDVRTKFYSVLLSREKIKVQEQNVELLQRQLQDVKNRFDAGTVSNFEVLRAEVALANAQVPLITARNDYRLSIETLRQALGFVSSGEASVTKIPEFLGNLEFTPTSFDLRSSLASAREHRPDLQRLKKLESGAEQGVLQSRAGYYPNVSLYAGYDWNKGLGSNSLPGDRNGWLAGLSSTWNIFDGRATAGKVVQSRSFLEQAKLALNETQLSVDVDVRRSISTFQEATELAEASKKVVAQAEEAVRLANARYTAGTATQLDVLTSQVDLTTARINQLEAYYSYNVAVATMRKAMGLSDELRPTKVLQYPSK
ncbi:MAG TPA: TolC family protein [Lacunisphaera sp.]|jgi:outer membrane protein TolC